MFKMILEEIDKHYQKYQIPIKAITELSLGIIITLYLYHRWKDAQTPSEVSHEQV